MGGRGSFSGLLRTIDDGVQIGKDYKVYGVSEAAERKRKTRR